MSYPFEHCVCQRIPMCLLAAQRALTSNIFKYLGLKTTVVDKVDRQMSQVILALRGMRSIKCYEKK